MNKKFKSTTEFTSASDEPGDQIGPADQTESADLSDTIDLGDAAELIETADDSRSAGQADAIGAGTVPVPAPASSIEGVVTPAVRQAAAHRATALRSSPATTGALTESTLAVLDPSAQPDYFGPYPNYANSPLPTVDPVTHKVVTGTGIRKFFDSLAGVGPSNANNLHNYIPVAAPDTIAYPGCDYYEIALTRFTQKMSSDLPATRAPGLRSAQQGNRRRRPQHDRPAL